MKKILKIVIIGILVLGVIAGTCYIFYKNMKPRQDPVVLIDYMKSDSKNTFNVDLLTIDGHLSSVGDNRMKLIVATHDNLDDIMNSLCIYVAIDGRDIDNVGVVNAINNVISARSTTQAMFNEYKIKTTSNFFPKSLGANDLYEQTSEYLTKYAGLVIELNKYVSSLGVNTESDLKYNMFDMYARIVIDAFEEVNILDGSLSIIDNANNITKINNYFRLENNFIDASGAFGKTINAFNKYYNKCDKNAFAENFATNINNVQSIVIEQSSNEQIATFYFKEIYGVGV